VRTRVPHLFPRGNSGSKELSGKDVTEHNITEAALTSTALPANGMEAGAAVTCFRVTPGLSDYAPSSAILLIALLTLGVYASLVNPLLSDITKFRQHADTSNAARLHLTRSD